MNIASCPNGISLMLLGALALIAVVVILGLLVSPFFLPTFPNFPVAPEVETLSDFTARHAAAMERSHRRSASILRGDFEATKL